MARKKNTTSKRRAKPKLSLIDLSVGVASANAVLMATAGTNAWSFFTDGWFGRKASQFTDNSWELSLNELVTGAMGGSMGMSSQWQAKGGVNAVVKRNLQVHGATSLATIVFAPVVGKSIKKLARTPIRQFNRLWKDSGLMQATGVKL